MIEIKWRIREYQELINDMVLDEDHQEVVQRIDSAKASGDYLDLIEQIGMNILGAEYVAANYKSADRVKIQEGIKRIVQSMYDNCPGLKKAVEADGTLDPDYLP